MIAPFKVVNAFTTLPLIVPPNNLKEEGFWGYTIHQKVSSGDLTVSGLVLEEGYMFLNPATPFEPTKYEEQNNNFVTYGL